MVVLEAHQGLPSRSGIQDTGTMTLLKSVGFGGRLCCGGKQQYVANRQGNDPI